MAAPSILLLLDRQKAIYELLTAVAAAGMGIYVMSLYGCDRTCVLNG